MDGRTRLPVRFRSRMPAEGERNGIQLEIFDGEFRRVRLAPTPPQEANRRREPSEFHGWLGGGGDGARVRAEVEPAGGRAPQRTPEPSFHPPLPQLDSFTLPTGGGVAR